MVALPSNTLVGHVVGLISSIGSGRVQQNRREESVVEDGVGNETAWVVSLAGFAIDCQWRTVAVADAAVVAHSTHQLGLIERLDVSSVVLVEVCETVVKEDMGSNVIRKEELQLADGRVDVGTRAVVDHGGVARPLCGNGTSVVLEVACNMAGGDGRESRIYGGIRVAILVLDGYLLHLKWLKVRPDCSSVVQGADVHVDKPWRLPIVISLLWAQK